MAQPDSDFKEEESLKEDLLFYFMNPCEKYRARRQIPWKLGLQILKIVMVTTQVIFLKNTKSELCAVSLILLWIIVNKLILSRLLLNVSQQSDAAAKKVNAMLGYINRDIES